MKKKGFTLVELLATIVILSVIALIATPIVLNVIESSKKRALVTSVKGLVESADVYYTNQILKGDITEDTVFDFEKGKQTSEIKLSYKGKVYNGKLILTSDSEVVTCIDDGKYYAYKEIDSDKVISGIGTCVYDGTTGDFDIMTDKDAELIQKQCDIDKNKLQEKIDKLQNEIALKEAAIEELQGSSSAKDSEILTLQGEKEELEKSLKELTDKIASITATEADVLSGKTIITSSGIVTGTMTNYSGVNILPRGATANITSVITEFGGSGNKYYGVVSFKPGINGYVSKDTIINQAVYGLNPAVIKAGALIGNYSGEEGVSTITGTYTSDATATAANILSGKTAYVNGSKLTGTMANKAGSTVAATTVTESDDGLNALITIPANGYYSTSSKISVPISEINKDLYTVMPELNEYFYGNATTYHQTTSGTHVLPLVSYLAYSAKSDNTYIIFKKGTYKISVGGSPVNGSWGVGYMTVYAYVNNELVASQTISSSSGNVKSITMNLNTGDIIMFKVHNSGSDYHYMNYSPTGVSHLE